MGDAKFLVKTHVIEGQHIRHYAHATRNGDGDTQYLEVKQYIPLSNQCPKEGDVTIIAAHATAFPKELYEPVWEDLLEQSERLGFRVRAIWFADASNQGMSGVLNEETQGNDPSWMDYARDMLHMTNVFRREMVQPIVGIGHSMGASTLIHLSLMHPRLFASLVLVDPIMTNGNQDMGPMLFHMASTRPDLFPTREAAEKIFKKGLRRWDLRTLDRWMRYGLRDTPSPVYPEPGKVTLRTTKANESWAVGRSQFEALAADGTLTETARLKYHDADPAFHPFYQAAIIDVHGSLPKLLPDVLYVMPERTPLSKEVQNSTIALVGTAIGGSGGVNAGRAELVTIKGGTHLCMFEVPGECARTIAQWMSKDLKAWRSRCDYVDQNRDEKSTPDMLRISHEWARRTKKLFDETNSSKPRSKM